MDKTCNEIHYYTKDAGSVKESLEEDCCSEPSKVAVHQSWWPNDPESEKPDPRQRWSYGSDISSIEAADNVQSRLCCSPVDEFDSTVSSDNEDLIVNNIDDSQVICKNFIEESPEDTPIFEKVICSGRNKKSNKNHDVDTADDELIDYSKRYTTESSMSSVDNKRAEPSQIQQRSQKAIAPNASIRRISAKHSTVNGTKVDIFGDYAETDLDQPTNYSLRYAEEDTDDEVEEKKVPQFYVNSDQEDTIQTYYTEGTPNNFSNATSMSDLLSLEDTRERDDIIFKRPATREQKQEIVDKPEKLVKDCRNQIKKKYVFDESKVLKEDRELINKKVYEKQIEKLQTPPQSPAEPCFKEKDNKIVTFNVEENDAQETPLMFSRSSSLDSLSEFDQQSILDDRSSIISEFSHRTSGAVSPSELPDSPTQTLPPSPHYLKQQNYANKLPPHQQQNPVSRFSNRNLIIQEQQKEIVKSSCLKNNQVETHQSMYENNSFFADGLVPFKEESMPRSRAHSIAGSTLSALTIDDPIEYNQVVLDTKASLMTNVKVRTSTAEMHQALMQKKQEKVVSKDRNKPLESSHYDEVDNKISSCTNYFPNQVVKEQGHITNDKNDKISFKTNRLQKNLQNNKSRDSVKDYWQENGEKNDNRNCMKNQMHVKNSITKQGIEGDEIVAFDSIRIYCTEDTPTYVSPYGSQSNLSTLSMLSFSDENIQFSESYQERPCAFYEDHYVVDGYNSDDTSASDESGADKTDRRIDVSPFDSQLNLVSFSLLRIDEEDEEVESEGNSNKTDDDKIAQKNEFCSKDFNTYKRLSFENSDTSDEDRQVLEECIKSGVSKLTRRRDDTDLEERHLF